MGNYHSTPIFSFRMKHTACGGSIEIQTDPKNTAYVVTDGARKRDTGVEEEGGSMVGKEIKVRMPGEGDGGENDAFAKMEGKVEDKKRVLSESSRVLELQERQSRAWEDPYEQSKRLRRTFRVERKGREKNEKITEGLKDKMSLGIDIVEETEEDRLHAGLVDFGNPGTTSREGLSRSKPMFKPKRSQEHRDAGSTKHKDHRKRSTKAKKLADIAAERKATLREQLSGNTRAIIDPFLSHQKVWKPDIAKRRKVEKAISTPGSGSANDDTGNDNESNEITKTGKMSEGKGAPSGNGDTALVVYGSDSD